MKSIMEITDDCLKDCQEFREIDRQQLRGLDYTYSISDESVEILEELDTTGLKLEAHQTNKDECDAWDEKYQNLHHEHVKSCSLDCCKALKEYRIKAGVYEDVS